LLKEKNYLDGKLTQQPGHYAQVHYLFNHLISNLSNQPYNIDLLNTWRVLYEISYQYNFSTERTSAIRSSLSIKSESKHPKFIFLITLSVFLLLILNFIICIILARRGHCCRKREYNCLNGHTQINIEKAAIGGSSPSSTNSNGTITQQLMVNTNCTTTSSSLSSTPPVDILHPINVTKKNGILRNSSQRKPSLLPEAIV
jgi:hypothetical protein